jgi:argininosuccinate lyase
MPLWGGRFEGEPSELMQRFSESLGVDLRMFEEDIEGSIAHATMLGETGIISADEARQLCDGLQAVRQELRDGAFVPDVSAEDIHMAVEGRLLERLGDVAGKLHTARSRNDQVATDVRLWMRRRLDWLDEALDSLIATLLSRIVEDGRVLMPGFTHLQRGQPIWLGHHLLAHAWPLQRDRARLADARTRLNLSPLGGAAMAGTPHPIDRRRTAALLDFSAPVENAMDAVAARDHELEVVAACAILQTHLSRMAEELVLWSTREFHFIRMGEDFSTGSSIMPQKRNPDAAELIRGKSGRVIGDLSALFVMVKGLPLAYNRDLQEDRQALFDAIETTLESVRVMDGMWTSLEVRREHYQKKLEGDFLLATELADYLAAKGVPFREAHHVAGRLVRWCEDRGENFKLLDLPTLRQHHAAFEADALAWLDPASAAERRTSLGGTAWSEVMRQVELLRNATR